MSLAGELGTTQAAAGAANGAAADTTTTADAVTTAAAATAGAGATRIDMPEEFKAMETMRKFIGTDGKVDPSVVLKSYAHLESQMGGDKIPVPKSDDDWAAVYDKLGRPKAADAYELPKMDGQADGVTMSADSEKFFREFAHKNGWNQKQAAAAYQTLYEHNVKQVAEWTKLEKDSRDKCEADLKREHGQAFDGFSASAKAALSQYADADFFQYLDSKGLGNDPRMIRVFGRIGKELMGDTKLKGASGNGSGAMSPAEIDNKINALVTERFSEVFSSEHPDHKQYADQYEALFKLKHGVK